MRDTKGVTLVALIITIIVLLILAGVAFTALSGENGLLKRAKGAGDEFSNRAENEALQFNNMDNIIADAENGTYGGKPIEEIPIHTMEQLNAIGKNGSFEIDGTTYIFKDDELTRYIIMEPINVSKIYEVPSLNYSSINLNNNLIKNNYGYVSDDSLVFFLDGIDNTGNGHSVAAATWKDLSGNDYSIDGIPTAKWLSNGLVIDSLQYLTNKKIPVLGKNITMEIVLLNKQRKYVQIGVNGIALKLRISSEKPYWNVSPIIYQYYNGYETLNKITNFAYVNNYAENKANSFMDNVKKANTVSNIGAVSDNFRIGSGGENLNGNIYAIRVYNRVLTDAELTQNYELDRQRFGF